MVKPILPRQIPTPYTVTQASNIHSNNAAAVAVEAGGGGAPDLAQPRKRGRKPGPLSRSAREAQRKLNHSIIEKARRTKINEALAALRQLVPLDFSRRSPLNRNSGSEDELEDDERDDGDDDGDVEYAAVHLSKRKGASSASAGTNGNKTGGKKEEKEFKLEVLERTVAYLQDLTQRHDELQMRYDELNGTRGACRCHERQEYRRDVQNEFASRKRSRSDAESVSGSIDDGTVTTPCSNERPSKRHEPLPPISSWLPLSPGASRSPVTFSPTTTKDKPALTPLMSPHLPTPPSSAQFPPAKGPVSPLNTFASSKYTSIPSLSLGPTALPLPTSSKDNNLSDRRQSVSLTPSSSPSVRTNIRRTGTTLVTRPSSHRTDASPASSPLSPEDETAASLLLTMRLQHSPTASSMIRSPLMHSSSITSPRSARSNSGSSGSPGSCGRGSSPPPPPPSAFMLPPLCSPSVATAAEAQRQRQVAVETPGSLLGLTIHRGRTGF